ncbi:hypothetical protein ACFE04_020878 [Oxalis oulophora]
MASRSSVELENVASVDMMTELLRHCKSSSKPDKRLILISFKDDEEEEPAVLGPNAALTDFGSGWKLQTVAEIVTNHPPPRAILEFGQIEASVFDLRWSSGCLFPDTATGTRTKLEDVALADLGFLKLGVIENFGLRLAKLQAAMSGFLIHIGEEEGVKQGEDEEEDYIGVYNYSISILYYSSTFVGGVVVAVDSDLTSITLTSHSSSSSSSPDLTSTTLTNSHLHYPHQQSDLPPLPSSQSDLPPLPSPTPTSATTTLTSATTTTKGQVRM